MELYVKAGPDGESIGDCPFAHFVRAVLAAKDLSCQVIPCTRDNKPDWLVNDHEGRMPCLRNGEDIVTESAAIVCYLEEKFPETKVECDMDQSVLLLLQGFFPAFANFMKKVEHDPKLEKRLAEEIGKLERHLETSGGPFLCKKTPTLADLSLAPKLYHLKITLEHFYPKLSKSMLPPLVTSYIEQILSTDVISLYSYPPEYVIAGWTADRK
eukprot:TRINITY_DN7506_c0_g1_i8.p1 TRINITY_DN7506_c0_g1~~TRINITY_DN7506_c0_g1_i8.p1  ORF type:complete len:212 (-),score=48.91 TRINITY_DN7506_c0_g1_i8:249-884(-)